MGTRGDGWIDVSPAHDGSLVKKVIEKGFGARIPLNAHVIGMPLFSFSNRLRNSQFSAEINFRNAQTGIDLMH